MTAPPTTTAASPPQNIHAERILILDFGSQYTGLIARRVREIGVYCEVRAADLSAEALEAFQPSGIILSGGPESVAAAATPRAPHAVFELGVPVLGICYGMQVLAAQLGGKVAGSEAREFGYAQIELVGTSRLFSGIEDHADANGRALLDVWMSHGDRVESLPPGFAAIARTAGAPFAAMADEARNFYGVQFHPEVTHTRQGRRLLERFVHDICGCQAVWNAGNIAQDAIAAARATIGNGRVILALSGGVDSAVAAVLLHEAVGDRLTCVFVDNGLLRLGEAEQVMATFARHLGIHVIRVDAEEQFLAALQGVRDPEEKRRRIGRTFIEIFEAQAAKLPAVEWLAQGTIYPDVIESAAARTGKAHVIKSHHNVGGLPAEMNLKLIEPLRELFKDEVRRVGLELGLPHEMVYRHPFPGPGLGVRILGEVKKEYADLLRRADHIYIEELRRHELYGKVSQAFAVFLPVRSVGVMGDARRYEYVIALRAVETVDFMTARSARLPYEFLELVSRRIINEIDGISRVTYDISDKPPATIEWE